MKEHEATMNEGTRELVERASRGEDGAVEDLLGRYLPGLERYVARHASPLVRAQESAGDLALSVCREVLESLRCGSFRYQGEEAFRQWLFRAAAMKLATRHRHWRALRRDPGRLRAAGVDDGSRPALAGEPHDDRTPSLDAVRSEELARFQASFAELPDRYQQAILLHHVESLGHAEIGARLGISEANSRMLLSRALARLARLTRPAQP